MGPDAELRPHGIESGIDWLEDFHTYLAIIQKGIAVNDPHIRRLFRSWDSEVYGSAHSPFGGDGPNAAALNDDELDEALTQFEPEEQDAELE